MSHLALQVIVALAFAFRPTAEHVVVQLRTLNLGPNGGILGVAISEDAKRIFLQQVLFSSDRAEPKGSVSQHLRLSSWNPDSGAIMAERDLGALPPGFDSYPCGRMETDPHLEILITCSSRDHLDVFELASLKPIGRIASADDGVIYDFALDPTRELVFILSLRKDGALWLSSYSLRNRIQQHATLVSSPPRLARASVVLDQGEGAIALAITRALDSEDKTEIYLCRQKSALACTSVAHVAPVSQMAFAGKQLLYVNLIFADRKSDCIKAIDKSTYANTRAYCSRDTGVHYALSIAGGKYVVGYTGTSKRGFFSEEVQQKKSTFSIWRLGEPNIAALIQDPISHGAFQNEIRVVAASNAPFFAAYQRLSNDLALYSIGSESNSPKQLSSHGGTPRKR